MYIGVDLGSTNLKAAVYDGALRLVDRRSRPVSYFREGGLVEFDAAAYFQSLMELLSELLRENHISAVRQIAFTGQAESLVVLDSRGVPLMNAISWMDARSVEECRILEQKFSPAVCEAVTGQLAVLPTWPATKILWLKRTRPELWAQAGCYMLLKDYIVYCLTGRKLADMSIATFSFCFDIYRKTYWADMLDAIGITAEQMPPLCEPCSLAGELLPQWSAQLGLAGGTQVNVGTLDHFAGMIGTGNVAPGGVTLSTGTVMALAAMSGSAAPKNSGIAMHYGFLPDSYVMLPVAESGGVCLEWFRKTCMPQTDYHTLNEALRRRRPNELLFLPYLVGVNAPDFAPDAAGVFWGLRQEHDAFDLAGAVMEGVSFLLRKNCDYLAEKGVPLTSITATGGGAQSDIWCQMHADATGLPVRRPKEMEAACLGAALIAAVGDGRFADYSEAAEAVVAYECTFQPRGSREMERKYRRFEKLYDFSLAFNRS